MYIDVKFREGVVFWGFYRLILLDGSRYNMVQPMVLQNSCWNIGTQKKTETDTQSAFFPQLKIGKVSFTWQHSIQVAINHQDGPLTYPTDGQMGDW